MVTICKMQHRCFEVLFCSKFYVSPNSFHMFVCIYMLSKTKPIATNPLWQLKAVWIKSLRTPK